MSKVLDRGTNNLTGVTIIDKNRYENISQVTHRFCGKSTVEEVIKNMVMTRLEDKNIIKK